MSIPFVKTVKKVVLSNLGYLKGCIMSNFRDIYPNLDILGISSFVDGMLAPSYGPELSSLAYFNCHASHQPLMISKCWTSFKIPSIISFPSLVLLFFLFW